MQGRIPEDIQEHDFDLIVVGAGINGAGIARDAAMRGLEVLLLDKGDISSGTSSWSSRLIHGGLRYLEHYEFGLVRESLAEREKLLRAAPHLVRPMPFVIPIYEHNKRGPRMVRPGMVAFDLLSFDKSMPAHRMLGRDEALRMVPGLNPEGLIPPQALLLLTRRKTRKQRRKGSQKRGPRRSRRRKRIQILVLATARSE
jgi:glycerol-3-phosphate dehydrogenase